MRLSLSYFVPGTDTAGAEIDTLGLTVNLDRYRMNIRQPLALGVPFRMADIMTELRYFAA